MTISTIHKTLGALALVSMCAAPALGQEGRDKVGPTDHGRVPVDQADDTEMDEAHTRPPEGARSDAEADQRAGETAAPGRGDPARGEAERTSQQGAPPQTGQQAQSQTGQAQRDTGTMKSDSLRLSDLDATQIEAVQITLQTHGFYDGPVDGKAGPQTRRALGRYYRAQADLATSGRVFAGGARELGIDASEIERVRGRGEPQRDAAPGRQQPGGQAPSIDTGSDAMGTGRKSDALDTTTEDHGVEEAPEPGTLDRGGTDEPLDDAPEESTFDATELH